MAKLNITNQNKNRYIKNEILNIDEHEAEILTKLYLS